MFQRIIKQFYKQVMFCELGSPPPYREIFLSASLSLRGAEDKTGFLPCLKDSGSRSKWAVGDGESDGSILENTTQTPPPPLEM